MPNKLSKEKSRYLLQHKDNPVNWHPWNEEAFKEAKKENKPLFVSIGYSSCHWCHVMAHECFEDKEVAKVLNDNFISIKVDKEEYPDIDTYYMGFISSTFGYGGWPLNVFVNSNKVPFYAITYLPKYEFMGLLKNIAHGYSLNKDLQDQILETKFYIKKVEIGNIKDKLKEISFDDYFEDREPKFPQAFLLLYLLDKGDVKKVKNELINIVSKGLFDHIEGGFFRYCVDSEWKIPHFEKMLYDQAALLLLCSEFYKIDKDERVKYAISMTIEWLERKMKLSNGLYGSATDADTKDGEGYYYSIEETDDKNAIKLFNLDKCGIHEGRYIPWINFNCYKDNFAEEIINKYKEERSKLNKPELDNKAIFSLNCFLGFSLLRCGDVLNDNNIRQIASRLFSKISKYKYNHVVYGNEPFKKYEYLEDYSAYLLFLSEVVKIKKINSKEISDTIKLIKEKFIVNGNLINTKYEFFDNLLLWQDSPSASGGSMLLNALLNLKSKELEYFLPLFSGLIDTAVKNPSFFGYWLYGFELL